MRWLLVVALCSCNRLLGLDDVQRWDAAPPDGPLVCPPIGTAPQYSPLLHQLLKQPCGDYTAFSSGYVIASCGTGTQTLLESSNGGAFAPVMMLPDEANWMAEEVRVAPDVTLLLAFRYRTDTFGNRISQYLRTGSTWTFDRDLPITFPTFGSGIVRLGSIAHASDGYHTFILRNGLVEEWSAATTDAWMRSGEADTLGLASISYATLDESGLRALLLGELDPMDRVGHVYYSDRMSAEQPWSAPTELAHVPATYSPYLSADCARIFVSGLSAVFYAQER